MSDDIAIKVENLTKIYKLYNTPMDRLKESLHPFRRKYHHDFHALHDVSFEIKKGETVGIIGKNGSGKSTLLKLISGVLTPTSGTVTVNGKISALLELGAGFSQELTGVENVYFSGTLMGYSKEEMDNRMDSILGFADIGEFVYQPVKTYSSGMFVRLAFAVAINVEPEILIIDEALSVGDIYFQQKCFKKIKKIMEAGANLIFVSHDMKSIQNLCYRSLLINDGIMLLDSDPVHCASEYNIMINKEADTNVNNNILSVGSDVISNVKLYNDTNNETFNYYVYDEIRINILLFGDIDIDKPNIGVSLFDNKNNLIYSTSTIQRKIILPKLYAKQTMSVDFNVKMSVAPGTYTLVVGCSNLNSYESNDGIVIQRILGIGPITIVQASFGMFDFYGYADLPTSITLH